VNWETTAQSTLRSGFRTTYIRKEAGTAAAITVPGGGPWTGASPFTGELPWIQDEPAQVELKARPELYISPGGKLFCSIDGIVWVPW
jgi:hypothetical protein